MSRETLIAEFLARHGYGDAIAEPLAQDASFRRYLRLTEGPRPAVLMDAPPPELLEPFVRIARHLAGLGISVPDIIAVDLDTGLLLAEDLGDGLMADLLDNGHLDDEALFGAIDVLVAMQRASPPDGLPVWGAQAMVSAALATLFDWWWPATFGTPAPASARADVAAALEVVLAPLAVGPVCFVHRDYFAGNIFWLPDRAGLRRIGIIDFQGAGVGHPAYDLASLLQDARRDIPPEVARRAIAHYLAARPDLDPNDFHLAYAACAAQRHLRVACQWVRLALRDRRPQYLAYGPRTWRLLADALREPAAQPLAAVLDRWIPPHHRSNPPDLAA
jgi:aminoglycoside/choline kinase family phosphotransferase